MLTQLCLQCSPQVVVTSFLSKRSVTIGIGGVPVVARHAEKHSTFATMPSVKDGITAIILTPRLMLTLSLTFTGPSLALALSPVCLKTLYPEVASSRSSGTILVEMGPCSSVESAHR